VNIKTSRGISLIEKEEHPCGRGVVNGKAVYLLARSAASCATRKPRVITEWGGVETH
jgi:hypothetical protein